MQSIFNSLSIGFLTLTLSGMALAETPGASVDVKMSPAGDFQVKSSEVKGSARIEGNKMKAEDIRVGLTKLQTGKELRDTHTKKYLKTDQFPDAILVRAEGEGGKGTGVIKIMGIEKPITGTYTMLENNKFMKAVFPLHLPDFIKEKIKFMGQGVQDDVVVNITVPVTAAAKAATPPAQAAGAPAAKAPTKAPAKKGK